MIKKIVILHGWQQNLNRWQEFFNLLSKNHQVYLPSLPGFGNNKLFKPFTLNDYSYWLQQYLIKQKIVNPYIIGYSFGGRVAIRYASQQKKLCKLILIDAAGIKLRKNWSIGVWLVIAKIGKLIFNLPVISCMKDNATKFLYKIIREKDYFESGPMLKKTMEQILAEDQRAELIKINVPTLILWGEEDKSTPIELAYYMKNNIKKANLKIFPKVNHALPFICPKVVIQTINDFIADDHH